MVWTDVLFRMLTQFAIDYENSALHNSRLTGALLNGYTATQVLAIRRLMDTSKNVISLRRLVGDLKNSVHLFTRENYACFDGLPYDYLAVQHKVLAENVGNMPFWAETKGPKAFSTSSSAHAQFDRLAGIDPSSRTREDRLPKSLLTTIDKWLDDSGADALADWSSSYLGHAGTPERRQKIVDYTVTMDEVASAAV